MLPASGARADEAALPAWVPSMGLGFGIFSRTTKGDIDAQDLISDTTGPTQATCGPSAPGFLWFCDMSVEDERSLDGGTLGGSAQLLGPSLASLPLRPRPFVHGGFFWAFDSRTIAEEGLNPASFGNNSLEPDLRTRLRGNPEYMWYAGGGVAFQMPIESRPVFLKVGAHYLEDRVDVVGTLDRLIAETPPNIRTEFTDSLTIGGAGPYFGIEAEIYRLGPVALDLVGDVLMTFPLSGTESQFSIEEPLVPSEPPSCTTNPGAVPCVPPAQYTYDADSLHWLGFVGLRFSWIGY